MAFIDIAVGAASMFGGDILGSYLGADLIGGTILGGAAGGSVAALSGGALGDAAGGALFDAAGGGFMDAAGGGLADYGSANAFADAAAGGDAGFGAGVSEAGSANAYADAAAAGGGEGAAASGVNNPFGNGSNMLSQFAGKAISPMLGNLASSMIGANGAQRSAQTQANAATQSIAMQQGMFNSSQANLQPFINGGANAMGQLNKKLSDGSLGGTFSGADYLANKDPGYQFQLDQGNQALQNSQAAKDGVLGGSSLKGLIDYNQGMASTGYQSAYNRWLQSQQNTYGQLAGAAGIGANSASAGATSAGNFSKGIGETMVGRGNVLGAGQAASAKNYSQAADGFGNRLYALSDMAKTSDPAMTAYDSGLNGQNNPSNQAALDNVLGSF